MSELPYRLYLLFIISFFLHLPERIPLLGILRFDLILIALIFILLLFSKPHNEIERIESETSKILKLLILYILISLPLVEWPGTVLRAGIPHFIKVVVFFFFTVSLITTEERLRRFVFVFILCQTFRILEPLYLHMTEGYWGAATWMGPGEMMDRLAGAPSDVINPNGLAFVIASVIPFFHYSSLASSLKYKILYLSLLPLFLYALVLTASRSGFLALGIVITGFILRSRKKLLLIILVTISSIIAFSSLSEIQKERYLSIYRHDVRGSETAQGRIAGNIIDFEVAMKKPIVGHGLGTSAEANFHAIGNAQISHFLYTEILQELGFLGLIIFLFFMKSIISNFRKALKLIKEKKQNSSYLLNINHAMLVWLWMNILFSFASYGLSTYVWYLLGGLSVAMLRLSMVHRDLNAI